MDPSSTPEQANDFYQRLVEHAAVAMIAADSAYRIVACNAAAGQLLGRSAGEMLGQSLLQAVSSDRTQTLARLLERTTRQGVTGHLDLRVPGRDGEERDLMVLLSPIPTDGQDTAGVAAWIIDETLRRQLADTHRQSERIASLGTLAGGVAHHFNNILGGVATFVDYALTSGDPAAMKRALQMTAEATGRVVKITQSLLSFAKCDTQEEDLADLTEVVLTFVHLVERPLAEQNIELNLDLRSVPILAVDTNRMHQILGHLLTNAEEAMPEGGELSIGLDHDGKTVRLTFADTGCGIRPEHLPLVFEPFFTTKGLLAGGDKINPGLGMSVAYGMVVEMGGALEVASEVGKGTTFTLSLPIPPTPQD